MRCGAELVDAVPNNTACPSGVTTSYIDKDSSVEDGFD